MSEELTDDTSELSSTDGNEQPSGDDTNRPPKWDRLLNLLVHMAEIGIGSSITVYTSGLAFSGVLVSRKVYFEESADFMKGTALSGAFEEFKALAPERPDAESPVPDYAFVHLRGCQVFTPGQAGMPHGGMLMRLRRSEVVGWSMGQFSPG